jgi:murein DD-endopeptidase MepM/ murein hydrolase activator NlpD
MRPVFYSRITQPFADPGSYASGSDSHGPAGHHTGIDWGSLWPRPIAGLPIRSSTPGTVVISEYNSTMGNWVGVYYARDNVTITYWHMSKRNVSVGRSVNKGDVLGWVGSTGNSTAAHLHVQANHGRGFNYAGHVHPGKWCLGEKWWRRFNRR